MTEKIKSCPWPDCLSKRQTSLQPYVFVKNHIVKGTEEAAFAVECGHCAARGPWMETETKAIAAWNTRVPDPPVEESS